MEIINILRGPKFFDMSIFDWLGTFVVAFLIFAFATDGKNLMNLITIFSLLIALGIITHMIVGVNTKFNYYLGLSDDPRGDPPKV